MNIHCKNCQALTRRYLLSLAALLTLAASAQAGVINVEYDGDSNTHVGNDGVFSTTGTVWNSVRRDTDLVDEFGNTTSVRIVGSTFSGFTSQSSVPTLFSETRFVDFGSGGRDQHMIIGLLSDQRYDIAVYGFALDSDIGSAVLITHDGGVSDSGVFGTPRGTATLPGSEGAEYVTFRSLLPLDFGGGFFGFRITSGDTGRAFNALSGFQLRESIPTVPEPSSMALLGIGMTGIAFISRRKRMSKV